MRHPNRDMIAIGKRIRQAREAVGLSGRALGKLAGLGSSAISQFENGRSSVGYETLLAIARETGVTLGWLMGEEAAFEPDPEHELPQAFAEALEVAVPEIWPPGLKEFIRNSGGTVADVMPDEVADLVRAWDFAGRNVASSEGWRMMLTLVRSVRKRPGRADAVVFDQARGGR